VEDIGVWEGTDWRWRLQWRRDKFEWEVEMEGNLMECIVRASMKRNMEDIQVWGDEASEKYTVNLAYECLAKQTGGMRQAALRLFGKLKQNVVTTA